MANETLVTIYGANPITSFGGSEVAYWLDSSGNDAGALFSTLATNVLAAFGVSYPSNFFTFSNGINFSGNVVLSPYFAKDVVYDQGNKGTVSSGTVTFALSDDNNQKLTVGGDLTISFSGWPSSGIYAEFEIELVNGGAHTITWPTVNWLKGDGTYSTSFSSMGVTLQTSGTNWVIVWSTDGGTTLWGRAA